MDFKHDLTEISKKELNNVGIKVPKEWNDYTTCIKYVDIHHRFFNSSEPYMVAYSRELKRRLPLLASDEQKAIQDIEERLRSCKPITPYMSHLLKTTSLKKSDFLLKNWNIYHLHLEKDSEKYTNRNLLFFQPQGHIVHFIDVRPHPTGDKWFDRGLFDIIYDNWPFLLIFRPDIKPTEPVPDDKVHKLLQHYVTVVPFRGGCLFPTNLGVVSSGDSSLAARKVNRIFNEFTSWELYLKEHERDIKREMRKQKLSVPSSLDYKLEIESGYFIAYEVHTQVKIQMFKVP